jgi:internalin A
MRSEAHCELYPKIRAYVLGGEGLNDQHREVAHRFRTAISQDGTHVMLADRGLTEVPEWLRSLTAVTALNLRGNHLAELPEWIGSLTALTDLDLSVNRLRTLPRSIGDLSHLTNLDLRHCQLTSLPEFVGELAALTSLRLGNNQLPGVPESLGSLGKLTSLDLSRNRIAVLPESLGSLGKLTSLDLSRNRIAVLPESLGNLVSLTSLDLSRNQLTVLPGRLRDLIRLSRLNIGDNDLRVVPESIGELINLINLDLWGNQLIALPDCMSNLTSLVSLDLWGNQLIALPDRLDRFTSLVSLNLADNELRVLPESLGNLPALTNLDVSGNPLRSPLREIAEEGTQAVKAYLDLVSEKATALWVSKLLVVGEGGVGKTSLIKALTGQRYDPAEPTTHGIDIVEIEFHHPEQPSVTMVLSSWDFGGQDIYHATHQFFLSDRSLFVLLWNARLGWEQAKLPYWLDIIKARAPRSQIILVATHAEGRPVDLPLTDLKASYPNIVDSVSVDSRTGEGIAELRRVMAVEAAKLPLMGSRWPMTWATGVKAVTKCGRQYATPEYLRSRLTRAGIADESHQAYLLRALHLLGDILYFDEDEELRDTIILRPQWVTGYIAKVLDSPEVVLKEGLLTRAHERELWSDLDPGLRDRFLLMMEKFDLSYRITDDAAAASLVVERLPWDRPPYQEQWDDALARQGSSEIRMRYQLNTVPPGIPTWFIAREHRFTTGIHWRGGALLQHSADDRVFGLIRADHRKKSVELAVRGPAPQLFFGILQDGFESTLRRYQGLEITRLVPCNCGNGNGTQPGRSCTHLYQYDPLLRRLERNVPEVECELSFSKVNVAQLLFGIAPPPAHYLMARLDAIDSGLGEFRTEIAWTHREILKALRRSQARVEAVCPSIFTIIPIARGGLRQIGMNQLALRLYCEQPGAFHGLDEQYIIKQPTRWLAAAMPYITTLLKLLKHGAPLIGPVLGVASDHLAEQLTYETRLMSELVAQMPELQAIGQSKSDGPESAELDADHRTLRALLNELDPTEYWGGLSRIYTPEGDVLWLCQEHARQYGRGP